MQKHVHLFTELFAQLGLPAELNAINHFIGIHTPLATDIMLADAPFWNPAQAAFLREEILEDADWAEIIDRLNTALRDDQTRH
jgi:hypothetical protein